MDNSSDRTVTNLFAVLHISERDITEQFVRSGGHGGQNVNKVASCVILTHRPSGITVRCEEARSQAQNRILARLRLAGRIKSLQENKLAQARADKERHRRQKRTRNKKAKRIILHEKRHRTEIKKNRRSPIRDE